MEKPTHLLPQDYEKLKTEIKQLRVDAHEQVLKEADVTTKFDFQGVDKRLRDDLEQIEEDEKILAEMEKEEEDKKKELAEIEKYKTIIRPICERAEKKYFRGIFQRIKRAQENHVKDADLLKQIVSFMPQLRDNEWAAFEYLHKKQAFTLPQEVIYRIYFHDREKVPTLTYVNQIKQFDFAFYF